MEKGYRVCLRCIGRKKIFKIGSGYSFIDTGGISVDCPLCLGEGRIKDLEKAIGYAKSTVDNASVLINTEKGKKNGKNKKT